MHIDSRIVNPPSCLTCRRAGRMAIHAMEARGFHSKLPSCPACRPAGRMAIHLTIHKSCILKTEIKIFFQGKPALLLF